MDWTPQSNCWHCKSSFSYRSEYSNTTLSTIYECLQCHWRYLIPDSIKVQLMPTNSKFNTQLSHSTARLAPMWKEIHKEFFYERLDFSFFGETVRDSVTGGLVDNFQVLVDIDYDTIPQYFLHLMERDMAEHQSTMLIDEAHSGNLIGKYEFLSSFGPKTVEIWAKKPEIRWSCDIAEFGPDRHYAYSSTEYSLERKTISLLKNVPVTIDQVQSILTEGVTIATKYGWTISQDTIAYLNKIVEDSKPLEDMSHMPIRGFRVYKMNYNGMLIGFNGHTWQSEYMHAECEMSQYKEHIKSTNSDRGEHGCGIYIYKDPAEALNEYHNNSAVALVVGWGDCFEGERGYRVEHCRIEKLWIWSRAGNQLRNNVYHPAGGIIVDAKQTDFFKEILTSGVDFENTHSNW